MARLPVIQASQPAVTVSGYQRADAEALARDTAAGVEGARSAANRILAFAEKEQAVRDTIAMSKASADASRELDDYRVELDKDGDYATKAARFKQRSDEVRQKYGDRFGGEIQARFLAAYDGAALGMENSVRHAARRDEVEQGKITIRAANEDLVNRAALARSDGERDALLKQVDNNLQDAVQTGIMTAAQHKAERRGTLAKFDEAQALAMIRTNPGGAIAALGTDRFQYMDPVRREALRMQAQARAESLGAQARAEARVDAQDLIAGFRSDIPPADADARLKQIRAVDPKLAARVESEQRTATTVAGFRNQPLPDQQKRLQAFDDQARNGGLSGEERQSFQRMQQVFAQEIQRWASDPFAAALQTNTAVKDLYTKGADEPSTQAAAREASLEWQTKNGVQPGQLAVVSKAQAKQLSQELATLDGAAFNQRWQQLKEQYGAHFEHLQRQISSESGGLGKVASIGTATELPDTPKGQAARANLIDAGKIPDADLKKLYANDKDLAAVRTDVEAELEPLKSSLGGTHGGMTTVARYTDDAVRLTAFFQQQGLSRSGAVKRAVEQLVSDHYAFLPDNGGQVRIPRTVDGGMVNIDTVAGNLTATRDRLDGAELRPPPDPVPGADPAKAADSFARRVKAYSRWMTEQGGRSAVLVYEANGRLQPVLRKDGQPVRVDFTAPAIPPLTPGAGLAPGVPTFNGLVVAP